MKYMMTCCKTGRFWFCDNHRHGDSIALTLGVKDYEITRNPK